MNWKFRLHSPLLLHFSQLSLKSTQDESFTDNLAVVDDILLLIEVVCPNILVISSLYEESTIELVVLIVKLFSEAVSVSHFNFFSLEMYEISLSKI